MNAFKSQPEVLDRRSVLSSGRSPDPIGDDRRRYLDVRLGKTIVNVQQGQCYVTDADDEVLSTVLGSCVSACVRDTSAGIGGMNHFLLPGEPGRSTQPDENLRYGAHAMEQLINGVLSRGGSRSRLEIKVFGGANLWGSAFRAGHANADFVIWFLKNEGLAPVTEHLRGRAARRLQYFPATGLARVRVLPQNQGLNVVQGEVNHPTHRIPTVAAGTCELFD